MSKINVKCGACGAGFGVPEARAGQTFKCTKCGADVRVPAKAPEPRPASQGSVQMGAGGGVLRKEDTVHGAKPVMAAPPPVGPKAIPQASKPTMIMTRSQAQGPMAPPPPPVGKPQQRGPMPPPPPPMGQPQHRGPMPPPPPMGQPQQRGTMPPPPPMGPPQHRGPMPPPPPMGQPQQRGPLPPPPPMGPPPMGYQQPPMMGQQPGYGGGRQPSGRMHQTRPGMAPPGPYGQPGFAPPRKKSNTGLIVGLVIGGIVLAGAAVGIGIAVSGGKTAVNNAPPVVTNTPTTPVEPEKTPAQVAAEALAAERKKVDGFKTWINTPPNDIRYEAVWNKYKEMLGTQFANEVSFEVSNTKLSYFAALGKGATYGFPLSLHYEVTEALLKESAPEAQEAARRIAAMACSPNPNSVRAADNYYLIDPTTHRRSKDYDQLLKLASVADFLVLEDLPQSQDLANYGWLTGTGFDEVARFESALADLQLKFPGGLVSSKDPAAQDLVKARADVLALINRVDGDHAKDGFARWAALAFTRFRTNYATKYFDTPYWTYAYARPFVYFQELADSKEIQDAEAIKKNLEGKARVLRQEVEFFEETIRKPFNLKRLYPDVPSDEERNNAPLEIIVLADQQSFETMSSKRPEEFRLPPGVRAYYSPTTRQIVTYDEDGHDYDASKDWWNKSVLIHEAWHFLSAIYMPDPQSLAFRTSKGTDGRYPAYASILIQEGLTDWVAGFDDNKDTDKIAFGQVNHIRLRTMQNLTRQLTSIWKRISQQVATNPALKPEGFVPFKEGEWVSVIDLRGLVQVTTYGLTGVAAQPNLRRHGLNRIGQVVRLSQDPGVNYYAGCNAVHYLHNFENGKYRTKWLQFVQECYTGKIPKRFDWDAYVASGYKDSPGMKRFMELFDLNGFDDPKWDVLNKEFLSHTMSLKVIDVGTGTEEEAEVDEDEDGDGGDSDDNETRRYRRGSIAWSHAVETARIRDDEE